MDLLELFFQVLQLPVWELETDLRPSAGPANDLTH